MMQPKKLGQNTSNISFAITGRENILAYPSNRRKAHVASEAVSGANHAMNIVMPTF